MRLINKSLKAGVASRAAYVPRVSNCIFADELIMCVFFDHAYMVSVKSQEQPGG